MPYIKATPVKASELQPGDLFSSAGPEYWNDFSKKRSIGEAVYLRTYADANTANDSQSIVFKIEVVEK